MSPRAQCARIATRGLNESPSQKEGKSHEVPETPGNTDASMKVPPKRKGNPRPLALLPPFLAPQ